MKHYTDFELNGTVFCFKIFQKETFMYVKETGTIDMNMFVSYLKKIYIEHHLAEICITHSVIIPLGIYLSKNKKEIL